MQFMILVYGREGDYAADPASQQDMVARHIAFRTGLGARRLVSAGLAMTSEARTVKVADGRRSAHDGPFAETKEQLGGFYIVEALDMDAAVAIAEGVPMRAHGSLEVRPLITPV